MSLTVYFTEDHIDDWNRNWSPLGQLNITHNLNRMADHCGLYEPFWRPEEMNIPQPVRAKDLLGFVVQGYEKLKREKEECIRLYTPPNKWGNYAALLEFTEDFIRICLERPHSYVRASR